jgi:hypothetical protein
MHRRFLAFGVLAVVLLSTTSIVAFFDEVVALKAELSQWEAAHEDVDFSDVIEQLDDIAGTVFTDTDDNAWYAPYVASLTDWGVVSGYRDASGKSTGKFGPGNPVTVAEVLKMSIEAANIDESECDKPTYHSQAPGHWAEAYVGCAEQLKVRVFAPNYVAALDRPAQRAEVLTIVHDIFGDQVPSLYAQYNDTENHRFEADIAYASLLSVVSGDTNSAGQSTNTFRPNDPINRAEAAKVLYQKLKEQAKEEVL